MTVRTMIPILAIVCVTMTTGWREKKRSDNPDYDIRRIPRELGLNADAVVRLKNLLFEIDDDNTAVLTVTRAVTVFNKNGRDHGELTLWYDKFQEIDDLEGTIYDENGIELKTLNDEDVKDWSSLSDYSLYEDSRVRVATLYENKYPYTVEFKYSIEYKGSLNWPVWFARESIDPVELSHFEVSFPLNMEIRYWCNRDTVRPNCTRQGDRKVYAWEERSLGKLSRDEVGDVEDITTIVRIAPTTFSLEDHSGSMTSWKDFGNWYRSLTQERNLLPEGVGKEIHSLIDSLKDQRDKVRALYRYMQSRTRYVSVRLGIGGWQPFDATYVHERGYGDCKALSNYMATLLKEAGVVSFPVLIRNGNFRYPMIREFPSNQFNHVILCVPMVKDTMWLECTSQSIPVGHIGDGNEDREALLITPEGGVVVKTPRSRADENRQTRAASVRIGLKGEADVTVRTTVTGNQQDRIRLALAEASPANRERWIIEDLQVPNVSLRSQAVEGLDSRSLAVSVSLAFSITKFAVPSGERFFFQPNLLERRTDIPPEVSQRLSPIRLGYAYCDIDSVIYHIPGVFTPEALPRPVALSSSFGRYLTETTPLGDTALVFRRTLEISQRIIPPEQYNVYRRFFQRVANADRTQVVLRRR